LRARLVEGQNHRVKPQVMAAAIAELFGSGGASLRSSAAIR
jgi:hypothetical protein